MADDTVYTISVYEGSAKSWAIGRIEMLGSNSLNELAAVLCESMLPKAGRPDMASPPRSTGGPGSLHSRRFATFWRRSGRPNLPILLALPASMAAATHHPELRPMAPLHRSADPQVRPLAIPHRRARA